MPTYPADEQHLRMRPRACACLCMPAHEGWRVGTPPHFSTRDVPDSADRLSAQFFPQPNWARPSADVARPNLHSIPNLRLGAFNFTRKHTDIVSILSVGGPSLCGCCARVRVISRACGFVCCTHTVHVR